MSQIALVVTRREASSPVNSMYEAVTIMMYCLSVLVHRVTRESPEREARSKRKRKWKLELRLIERASRDHHEINGILLRGHSPPNHCFSCGLGVWFSETSRVKLPIVEHPLSSGRVI